MPSVRFDGRGGDPQGPARGRRRPGQESGSRGWGSLARVSGPGALRLPLGLGGVTGGARSFEVG